VLDKTGSLPVSFPAQIIYCIVSYRSCCCWSQSCWWDWWVTCVCVCSVSCQSVSLCQWSVHLGV